MELVVGIYRTTELFPTTERYGLSSQMQRSSISIPSNIAEGSRRGTRKDYRHFILVAYGSGAELETQIELAHRLGYLPESTFLQISNLLDQVMRMLNRLVATLSD